MTMDGLDERYTVAEGGEGDGVREGEGGNKTDGQLVYVHVCMQFSQ